jgi:hypothetical protein
MPRLSLHGDGLKNELPLQAARQSQSELQYARSRMQLADNGETKHWHHLG